MPSLWGSKKNGKNGHAQNDEGTGERPPNSSAGNADDNVENEPAHRPPPDEHTRLLPNRLHSGHPHFLDPDDPAVSPYNLWTVRIVRWLTLLFSAASFVWWVLQLVALFVTPPGFHTRGSGFYSFAYASLALFTILFSLVFFGAPARAVRILSIFMAGMLLVDMIITLAVERNRHEEGWVGIASVICKFNRLGQERRAASMVECLMAG